MAKEWILNNVMNRFQLNFKRNVGAVAEEIRKCSPHTVDEWRSYYYEKVRHREHIDELGRRLHTKISEVVAAEVESISEEDCIQYMHQLVVDRTYDGYTTEIKTVYGQLQTHFQYKIEPAPDEWDRSYNVDFFIKVKNHYIGLQIKPAFATSQITQIFKEREIQTKTHKKFTQEFGGRVFYVVSMKQDNRKIIANPEVVDEIATEIKRLEQK